MPTTTRSATTSHTFSQEVLRALALGSFPQSPDEKAKSVSVVRSALRCRRHRGLSREQMEMVGNCGGPGSGRPGPCPDPTIDAKKSAERMAELFGLDAPDVQIHAIPGERTYGESSGKTIHLVNIQHGLPINKQINFPLARPVSEGEHLAAHEIGHWAYTEAPDIGKEAAERLSKVEGKYGSAVSMYGSFGGKFENLMELGAVYSHSPESLKAYSPEMYSIADDWVKSVRSQKKGQVQNDSSSQSGDWTSSNLFLRAGASGDRRLRSIEGGLQHPRLREVQESPPSWQARCDMRRFDGPNVANTEAIRVSKLAPYLHDLLGDVTKKQSRVIAQTVKKGIERKWADSTVARTLARYADLDPERAKVVSRTEMARARSDVSLGKRPDAAKVVFVLGDEDACPICRAMEGTVRTVRKAQGVIPVHPNCILPGNEVECADLVAASKSFYDGPAVKVTLLGGRFLTVTENHPILTTTGFVAAKDIRKGDQVIYAARPEGVTKAINPDYDAGPSAIEEVFESLRMAGGTPSSGVPTAAEDFHGDARFFDGEVEVVHTDSLLGSYRKPFFSKRANKELLGDVRSSGTLNPDSAFFELGDSTFAPTGSIVGGASDGLTVLGGSLGHFQKTGSGETSEGDSHTDQTGLQSRARDAHRGRYFVERFAPFVSPASVVHVKKFGYQGHVYDLQADVLELYICNGVIVKNCTCRWEDAPKGAKVTANQFCATGAGGGIDPHCSPDDGDGEGVDPRIAHINLPESREEATAIAWAMRDSVIGDDEESCAVDGDCLIAAAEGFMLHPDAEIWGGRYIDSEKGPWEHQIFKLGDWFIDVTEDQFSNVKSQATVFNTDDLLRGKNGAAPYQYAGFERLHATEEMTLKRRKPGYRPGTVAALANYEGTDRLLDVPKPTANFRDSLLRFSALNQFCATGEGGGVDPSCSPGGKGSPIALSDSDFTKMKIRLSAAGESVLPTHWRYGDEDEPEEGFQVWDDLGRSLAALAGDKSTDGDYSVEGGYGYLQIVIPSKSKSGQGGNFWSSVLPAMVERLYSVNSVELLENLKVPSGAFDGEEWDPVKLKKWVSANEGETFQKIKNLSKPVSPKFSKTF